MAKLWALKDFTSSVYKLHKITNSPSPLQKYLVKHVLYCFSLTSQAASEWQKAAESVWYPVESVAKRGESNK